MHQECAIFSLVMMVTSTELVVERISLSCNNRREEGLKSILIDCKAERDLRGIALGIAEMSCGSFQLCNPLVSDISTHQGAEI